MIAQLFAEFHATFEVFHHCQCVVVLGFQFGDALVQGVLVEQIFCFFLYAIMALFETVKKILYYRNYMAQTADCLEKDSSALQCIRDRMEYSRVMNENRGMSLADLMNEGSELYNNSYARMVQEQGEEKAEAFVSRCTTQIAENGEIIRSFAA